jgi:hypothetical protein
MHIFSTEYRIYGKEMKKLLVGILSGPKAKEYITAKVFMKLTVS